MIPLASDFDLGKDQSRIKDRRDGERQSRTAEILLQRLFADDPDQRWELQLLADEVGMGKTFVALAVAYSLLAKMRDGLADTDLRGCAKRVLVIAPQKTLAQKWVREVGEFVSRCVADPAVAQARKWFRSEYVDRPDELARVLRTKEGPAIVVTTMGTLTDSRKLQHFDLKRRILLGVLFRFWGNSFKIDARERLLKGAPAEWPHQQRDLTAATADEWNRTAFAGEDDMLAAVRAYREAGGSSELDALLQQCKEISEPYVRGRDVQFRNVEQALNRIYRSICFAGLRTALPLVLVDEAHHWKNGPNQKTNGYGGFEKNIAPITRRAILLTATPFQLRPAEMLELLRVGSVITPCAAAAAAVERRQRMDAHRDNVLGPVLENAARQSRAFADAWARLSPAVAAGLESALNSPGMISARGQLGASASLPGRVDHLEVARVAEGSVVGQPVELRDLLREALRLFAFNADLSQELGSFVVRHRRSTDHRLFRVGAEYVATDERVLQRGDRASLHASPGIDVRGDAELPHYLLMRCVTDLKHGRGRSSLGTALTGCYSTLLQSAEGRSIREKMKGGDSSRYFDLLLSMVEESRDAEHPKVRAVVDAAMTAWHRGEKMLIFCFRTHTAKRLEQILSERIGLELESRRRTVLDGAKGLQRLRGRITRRDGDLAPLALDRVLWSLRWAARAEDIPLPSSDVSDLRLTDAEFEPLAVLALRYGVDLLDDRPDRVFLHRAVEHLIAKRMASSRRRGPELFGQFVERMIDEAWVRTPYGVSYDDTSTASDGDGEEAERPQHDSIGVDERGVHTTYSVKVAAPDRAKAAELADALRERRMRARRTGQVPLVDTYADGPSFWLGKEAEKLHEGDPGSSAARAVAAMHRYLLTLSRTGPDIDWKQRMLVFQALRRAVLRESVLVRILPARSDLEEQGWGDILVERLFEPWEGQRESTADRLAVFLEDLKAADGAVYEDGTTRHSMYEATRMRDTRFVVLVDGSTIQERRERAFAGFNSPLLPEVMICTSVGQEGIDLHRHCRHVVHYDLAWNPAVLEQRTGRVDRIGSKTFRERLADSGGGRNTHLEVGVPFLAGTYDERMYEEIRVRAQTFEVLTGGDVASDNLEGRDDEPGAEGREENLAFVTLPRSVIADLRVRLHVWEPVGT